MSPVLAAILRLNRRWDHAASDWVAVEEDNSAMVLSEQEESLINVVRALPPDETRKVLNWACQLANLADGRKIEWSDSWTDQDAAEATASAIQRFENEEPEER